ncbi:unnamed protein product [Enterobius vermicularis]|uniref:Ovule protein n=1 Tax=Enterobius vermicularis TaxID=51028 RepID=A0A0N4VQZ5_ENTVE|nr:unnamed protein product [Enterobius vermicularis]
MGPQNKIQWLPNTNIHLLSANAVCRPVKSQCPPTIANDDDDNHSETSKHKHQHPSPLFQTLGDSECGSV